MEQYKLLLRVLVLMISVSLIAACAAPAAPPTEAPETVEETPEAEAVLTEEAQVEGFDWRRFEGETLRVFVTDNPVMEFVEPKLDEFEALTGMKVEFDSMDATSYRNNLPVRLTAQSGEFDVMSSMTVVDGLQFEANGWYEPLDPYINNPSLTNPDWDFEDFPEGIRQGMQVGGDTVTVFWEAQTDLLYYRKDILEEQGLEVPETFEDWAKVAEAVHDPDNQFYGVALRGAGYQTTTPYSAFLYGYCSSWLDENGDANINSKEAVDAFEMYGKLGNQYGPPGIVAFDWQVPSQQLAQGRVFSFLDINLFVPTLENPDESRVAGDIGYAMVPAGPCGPKPFTAGWGWAINPFSQKKDQAWYFIQWATSKELNLEAKLNGWPSPRASAWESEEFVAQDPTPQFTEVVLNSYDIAITEMNPPVTPGVEAREIVGNVAILALEGASREEIQQAADEANADLQGLIDEMRESQ